MLTTWTAFAVAATLALMLTPIVRRLALRRGFVDVPVDRSMHREPKPYLGGLAMYLAFLAAVALGGGFRDSNIVGIVVGGGVITLLGLIDDKLRLSPLVKFAGQIAAAAVLVYGFGVTIDKVSNLQRTEFLHFHEWSGPLTILWLVSMTNVVNLIDGLDGLAAGISAIASVTLLAVSIQQGLDGASLLTAALAGATVGFLRYNFYPAKIFMGDAGAMFLGYTLAAISVHGLFKSALAVSVVVPVIALGLPILDTAFAIIRRIAAGKSIGHADKDHLHHRLLQRGLSHRGTVLVMLGISGALGATAVLVARVAPLTSMIITASTLTVVLLGAYKFGLLGLREAVSKQKES